MVKEKHKSKCIDMGWSYLLKFQLTYETGHQPFICCIRYNNREASALCAH